jgi:serine/threonine protein kinase
MIDNKFNLKVADFGLAKGISQNSEMINSFVGTLAYSCPQIVQN